MTQTGYQHLLTDIDNGILTITINRPDKLNALNKEVLNELKDAFDQHRKNPNVKGVILTGAGNKAFVAGADITEFPKLSKTTAMAVAARGQAIFREIEQYPKPVIAAVNGFALGGGCELAMACHLRIAAENAKFGQPEPKLGLIPGYGGTQRLVQLIGKSKAFELLMTADMLDAAEALQLGLVNYVVTQEELLPKCADILGKISRRAPMAITQIIRCVDAYYTDGVDGYVAEVTAFGACFDTEDVKEGVGAFLAKRTPNFTGR